MPAVESQSFLPTIKCSDCGIDIEISQLADHVCAPSSVAAKEPTSPKLDRAATFNGASFNEGQSRQSRPRMPPPRIDARAANKPFLAVEPSPEPDYNDMYSRSAPSPGYGRPFMNRSATSPLPHNQGPPSPDLSSNLDSAFPRFPTKRSITPSTGRSNRDMLDPSPTFDHNYAAPSPLFAPLSPRINGGESIMKRMDNIAPGPFAGRADDRRPSTASSSRPFGLGASPFSHKRTDTRGSSKSSGFSHNSRASGASHLSRGSVLSNGSSGLPARPKPGMAQAMPSPPPPSPPPKDEEPEGIDAFLARLQKETLEPPKLSQETRSNTFPMRQETQDEHDFAAPPEDRREPVRRPTDIDSQASNFMLSSRAYDPRVSSSSNKSNKKNDLAPLPVPAYARDYPGDAVNTPSDSGLSEDSYASSGFRSVASSRSSPPMSEASHSRHASKMSHPNFSDDIPVRRTNSPEMFLDPRPAPPQPIRAKTPDSFQPPRAPYIGAPESPMDPAIQRGFDSRPEDARPLRDPALVSPLPLPRNPEPEPRSEINHRPAPASKGRCRGCSEQIFGKSVKDSSGRLTGRYHKQCFVCRTCQSPFPTAEFYVFENSPYCEQHYHQLNGSLCRACNRGIEGQYLETDQRLKFHPRCFNCFTCRIILRDDYFEVGGRHYCERHAYSAVNQQNKYLGPGNPNNRARNLQKRRTRLMMM